MTESSVCSPHVYYPVSELSAIKDVRVMKNTKIKTIGYIYRKKRTVVKDSPDSAISVAVDLVYNCDIVEIYPYILFGVLCTVNEEPVVAVKFLKRFKSNEADLIRYKELCLSLRQRIHQYDDVRKLAEIHNWS